MLTIEERQQLTQIIAKTYDFTDGDTRSRRVMLESAGLEQFLSNISLSGPPRVVVGDLIGRLEKLDYYLAERPSYHPLGALLTYVLSLGELSGNDASFIAQLIVHYSLVLDPRYIDQLRNQYNITESTIPTITSSQLTPPPAIFIGNPEPTFGITIPNDQGLERIINSEDNFLDVYVLAGAIYSAQAVCRIETRDAHALGTGFLIGPDLLLTNQHVLMKKDYLTEVTARFDYRIDNSGVSLPGRVFKLQPDFYYSSDAAVLDYALVRLQDQPLKHIALSGETNDLSYLDLVLQGKHRGYLVLTERFIQEHARINIIQHPDGRPMKVVLTQNYVVVDMTNTRVQYVADTMEGSSGSPVFNQNWEVVALHHSGKPYPPDSLTDTLKKSWKGHYRVNEGIPIRAILKDFRLKGLHRYLPRV